MVVIHIRHGVFNAVRIGVFVRPVGAFITNFQQESETDYSFGSPSIQRVIASFVTVPRLTVQQRYKVHFGKVLRKSHLKPRFSSLRARQGPLV